LFFGGAERDGWQGFPYHCHFGVVIVLGCPTAGLHVSKMDRDIVVDGGVSGRV